MPVLLDNKNNGFVGNELKKHNFTDSKLAVLSSFFTLYGFDSLKDQLKSLDSARIILNRWNVGTLQDLIGSERELAYVNKLDQKVVAKEFANWIKSKTEVKAVPPLHVPSNLIHLQMGSDGFAISGMPTLTPEGLGDVPPSGFQMNTGFSDANTTISLLGWFDAIWNDKNVVDTITKDLIRQLDWIASDQPASFVYYLTLFNLFKNYLEDIDEDTVIREKTGFKNTTVWNKLYKYQKDGVVGAIDKLEKHNGCIIADSVGLGKTFSALAVIKYYELRNYRVLVLCPKKLRDNWTMYTINDNRNLLAADRFNYDVLNHTDLTRDKGYSGEIKLDTLNWSNYDLVVIDESHNFRNTPSKADGSSRYERLMNNIIRSGVKTRVLMLSATPVNNQMKDLKNQVAFITEGDEKAFESVGIQNIDSTLSIAQRRFNTWSKLPVDERTTATLLDSMNFDYFKLLDIVTIARSRKHIEKYYGTEDIGKFPERLPPINIYADIDSSKEFPPMEELNKTIRRLSLAGYSPLKFVREEKKSEYAKRYDQTVGKGKGVFKQIDREESLIHLMRVNLLKRMESSIESFSLTVTKLAQQVDSLLAKIDTHENGEVDSLNIGEIQDFEMESSELEPFMVGNKTKVLLQDLDLIRFRQELEADAVFLNAIAEAAKNVGQPRDAKLDKLRNIIVKKVNYPLNPNNKKVIIFTAFADTAQYLYKHIAPWAKTNLKLNSALITGGGTNKTTLAGIGSELNTLLTYFSPRSKELSKVAPGATEQIDILIATDCISEGQNLQDCDTLINYDIHWNPVRIIQRFGRIDRLGSINKQIQLINFWPNMELDEYINLEDRVSGRMVLLDISSTGEENVIDDSSAEMNDLEYRRKQLKQLQDTVVDLEEMNGGVSITDLTLNDFRMDLTNYMADKSNQKQVEKAPFGLYSVVEIDDVLAGEGIEPGVVFCLKNINQGKEAVQVDENYALAPYFLVYVTDEGEVSLNFCQSKRALDILKRQAFLCSQLDSDAIAKLRAKTKQGKDMSHYQSLLATAIDSIGVRSEEKGVESLFKKGGTVLTSKASQGLEDFIVVSYLILMDKK